MKILQIHNFYQKHGGEDVVVETERLLLVELGHEVISVLVHNNDIKKVLIHRRKFYAQLSEVIKQNPDIDLAHVHNVFSIIGPDVYEYLKARGIPIVQTIHNYRFLCPNGLFFDNNYQICELCKSGNFINSVLKKCYRESYLLSFLMQNQVKLARKSVLKNVDRFIVLSNFARNKFIENSFPEDKIVVKPNFLFPQPPEESFEHNNYGLFIGRLSKEKGIDIVIEAFKNVDFQLKVAGTGDMLKELKEKYKGIKNIEFLGFVAGENKNKLIAEASFILIPSLQYENFPVSVLDAFSRGKSVVASNVGSIPEIVLNGYSGMLFKKGDVVDLTRVIKEILAGNNFEKFGRNAHKEFMLKFQTKQNYQRLMEIYGGIIKEKNQEQPLDNGFSKNI